MTSAKTKQHPSSQNVKVAVDNCIFTVKDGRLHVLLIQMRKPPFAGAWALPGGLIRDDETLDDAAARILEEQTGVTDVYLEQLYTFSRPDRDPFGRVISAAYFALVPAEKIRLQTVPKYESVRLWKVSSVPHLAYDHDEVVAYARKRLAWKLEYTNVVWSLLPPKFTLAELQNVYEAVIGEKLDKRNFRKKVLSLNLIKPVGEPVVRGAHRPAMLYHFTSRKSKIVEVL
jgi:8-oxo-dGTP diphosphatase